MAVKLPEPERLTFTEAKRLFEMDYPDAMFRVVRGGVDAWIWQPLEEDQCVGQPLKEVPPPREVELLLARDGWHCKTTELGRLWSPTGW